MRTDLFEYELPPDRIAQQPLAERDQSRLLVVRRGGGSLDHRVFHELPDLLTPGDLLVLNDTRVLPARLLGRRARTGGRWEGLFLQAGPDDTWELLSRTRGRLAEGDVIEVEPGPLRLTAVRKTPEGHWLMRPEGGGDGTPVARLERHGQVPLPPYIRKGRAADDDRTRYQTVFARQPGAVAAPTAGLHFTPRVFDRLRERGIGWTFLTLHVGLGTFQPLQTADIEHHRMHREWGELSPEAAGAIEACRGRGGKVVAVGTTSVRVLETVAASGPVRSWSGETELYIRPSYQFRAVDALVTNFHLPRSSLLLLVGAFAGVDLLHTAYMTAITQGYRFFSYGDAMLIL